MSQLPMNNSISVAVCTYNGEKFIAEQLASIFQQTLLPNEVILSDDGSSDGTVDIASSMLSEFASNHSNFRFQIIQNEISLGVSGNFKAAMSACTNDLIALSDQDDVWYENKLEILSEVFSENQEVLLVNSDAELVDAQLNSLESTLFKVLRLTEKEFSAIKSDDAFTVLLRRNVVTGATAMIRNKLFEMAQPFPTMGLHDEWLGLVAGSLNGVFLVDQPLIKYRQHSSNHTGARKLTLRARIEKLNISREERNQRLFVIAKSLCDLIQDLGSEVSNHRREQALEKFHHELVRIGLPSNRLLRLKSVLSEFRTGRYFSSGLGLQDVLRDLVQPS